MRASPVLRWLVMIEHAIFVVLVGVGFLRSLTTGASVWLTVIGTVLLVGWYLLGARGVVRHGVLWLLVLTLLWAGLVCVSTEFVWVAFALWLLAGHFLTLGWAIAYAALVLLVTVGAPWLATGGTTTPGILGPSIGAVFALVISLAQHQLIRDDQERRALVADLVAAQDETRELHDQLSTVEREAAVREERTRISRDVHDTIAQTFSSILLLARGSGADPGRALGHIETLAATGLAQSRDVVGALAPADVEADGLTAALRRLLAELQDQAGIATELRAGELPKLPRSHEVALLRTVQGALANVRQHAQATRVVLTLDRTSDGVRLDVVDDGRGFDAADWAGAGSAGSQTSSAATGSTNPTAQERATSFANGGYGLRSTRARLRELGGGLEIESSPGHGTALSAHLPWGGER